MIKLWERVRAGQHTAWVGGPIPPPEDSSASVLIRVACDRQAGPFAPVLEAWQKAQILLGAAAWAPDSPSQLRGLRGQLLGGGHSPVSAAASIVEVLNRLAAASDRPAALVLEAVDKADYATHGLLRQLLSRPGWLHFPLVLGFSSAEPSGSAAELLETVKQTGGASSVQKATRTGKAAARKKLPELPFSCLQVLRAAALVGPSFSVDLVAHVLETTAGQVLAELQRSVDLGVPLEDHANGHMRLSELTATRVSEALLPSLGALWHQRAAAWFDTRQAAPRPQSPPPTPAAPIPSRAASHFEQAGQLLDAAQRNLDTAFQAGSVGAYLEALEYVNQGLVQVAQVPSSRARHLVQARLMSERARLHWVAAGPGADFTLTGALNDACAAEALLAEDDPISLKSEMWTLTAQIQYDLGTPEALEGALERLTRASRALHESGDAHGAARLLNDQAAVWVRIGDPIRAAELLDASRKVFERSARRDPVSALELGDTLHLQARLPLHVPARPGFENEAIRRSIDRARDAGQIYERVGDTRGLARLWETLGRLHVLADDVELGSEWLSKAVHAQQQNGDVIGLARTAEAFARLLGEQRRFGDALEVLMESMALNAEKGAVRGLRYLERTLVGLTEAMTGEERSAVDALLKEAEDRLSAFKALAAS